MEIISVTRGDHPSDPWRLSPSIKGMFPFRPACLIDNTKVQHPQTRFVRTCPQPSADVRRQNKNNNFLDSEVYNIRFLD